jgi:hypothetical protein
MCVRWCSSGNWIGAAGARATLAVATLLVGVAGCVTINIYFPAAAAERAADRIIDEVWQIRKGEEGAAPAKPAPPQ